MMRTKYWAKDRRDGEWKAVRILTRWRSGSGGPRNVLVEYPDGHQVVRPFRGLRVKRP